MNPILDAWKVTAQRTDAPAIFDTDGSVLRTFADIERESRTLTFPGPGPTCLQLANSPTLPATLLALWRAGHSPMLLDASLPEADALAAARTIGARTILRNTNAPSGTPKPPQTQTNEHAPTTSHPSHDFLKLTSGTTGAPRAIAFTAAQLLADCDAVCDTMGITADDLNFGIIPWSHSYGFSNLVLPLLCRGIPVVAASDRLPRAILAGLAATGATVFPGVPVFFQKLAELDSAPLPKLRLCISAGAPLAPETATAFRARFGVKIHSFYGSSECGGIAFDASEGEVPAGTVGPPMRGVRIVRDATGRIEVHSPAVGLGYLPEPDPAVLGDGRFIPGDIVEETPHGLRLCGRVSDFINIAGRKLNPAEVEAKLRGLPGLREIVVFAIPGGPRGEEPAACITGEVTEAEFTRQARELLPAWQTPRHVWKLAELPVNERGKLSRRALAEHFQGRR